MDVLARMHWQTCNFTLSSLEQDLTYFATYRMYKMSVSYTCVFCEEKGTLCVMTWVCFHTWTHTHTRPCLQSYRHEHQTVWRLLLSAGQLNSSFFSAVHTFIHNLPTLSKSSYWVCLSAQKLLLTFLYLLHDFWLFWRIGNWVVLKRKIKIIILFLLLMSVEMGR